LSSLIRCFLTFNIDGSTIASLTFANSKFADSTFAYVHINCTALFRIVLRSTSQYLPDVLKRVSQILRAIKLTIKQNINGYFSLKIIRKCHHKYKIQNKLKKIKQRSSASLDPCISSTMACNQCQSRETLRTKWQERQWIEKWDMKRTYLCYIYVLVPKGSVGVVGLLPSIQTSETMNFKSGENKSEGICS
jgi:hypothetical protein